MEKIKIIKKVI